jgi:hypothetical protein
MNMRNRVLECWMGAGLIGLTLSASALGQTITGSVNGTVTDPAGAVIPNATVTATNIATGVAVTGQTNESGQYSIRFLQIGQYTIKVKREGFSEASYGPFNLEIDQTAKIDAKLTVGSETTVVNVRNEAQPILDTDNGTIATTFTANTIESIPLNGRNFSSLTIFLPGAVTTQPTGFSGQNGIERDTNQAGQTSINGNRNQTNNYLLDGIEINETINNVIGYNPSPDALGQVQVISANAPAEYGNVNGGDVIAVLKSGSNNFHGSVYGFLENYNLDANTWYNNDQTPIIPKSDYTQTTFGATIGGPIKRDKLFFFADYEASRYNAAGINTDSVATAAMRSGDFSALLNPLVVCATQNSAQDPNACPTSKETQLYDPNNNFAPYVNDQGIPINSPAAKYLFAHPNIYPLPNAAPAAGNLIQNNYQAATKTNERNDQGDVKIDWTPTQADRLSFRYLQGEAYDFATQPLAIEFPGANDYPTKGIAINFVHTFSPELINEFRGGFSRIRWIQGLPTDSTGVFGTTGNNILGIPGTQPYSGFSAFSISGGGNIGNSAGGTNFIDNIFMYGDDLTWQKGKHLIKTGAQFVRYQQNNFYPGNDGAMGQFSYNGNFTSDPLAATGTNLPGTSGNGFADFVLDRSSFVGIGSVAGRTGQRQWRSAYFVQDDWKMMPNLTLNLGVRYEFDQPIYEVNNKETNVDLATGVAYTAGEAGAAAIFGNGRALYHPTYGNVMPRIGFAYQPTPKFVVRGGYGITTDLEGTGANLRLTYNPPFQASFEATGIAPSASGPGQSFALENGFTSANTANFSGTTYRAWDSHLKPSFIGEYSLTTEYQVTNSASLTLGYVGEGGQHLIQAVALNQLHAPCVLAGVVETNPNTAACEAVDPAPYISLVGQGGSVVGTVSEGMMNYNALQASFRQRVHQGLEFTLNYSYGRSMTNSDGFFGVANINGPSPYAQNAYDNHAEYGPSGMDVRHNANGTLVYALPIGRGKEFGGGMNSFLDEAVGGWKLAMTGVAYTGFPVNPNDNNDSAGTNNKTERPNQLRKLHIVNRSINDWFGTDPSATACAANTTTQSNDNGVCAYQQPGAGEYGNAAVNSLRAPGYQQYDFSGFKDFAVFHEYKVGFRVDAFNALNIASYNNPDNTVQDTTFGQITNVRSPQRQIQFSANFKF